MCALVGAISLCAGAHAACTVSSDAGAVVNPISMATSESADIIVSMSLLPKLLHLDYASAARDTPSCELGQFVVNGQTYTLYGSDDKGRSRKALSAAKGQPIAQVLGVTNIMKAIEASKQGKSAPVEGYLLATLTKSDFTGWRYYTGLPDPEVLKHDMAEVLGGGGTPIFRNGADGKTSLFLPEK
ncbi:hypothetical protein ACSBM8_11850 [Sphingomonas sp. ASY06-1R]|jgi:hypothetical protein|uniref:hypothetical protein n=1 Tax=Sphingomonas sp. ASY06-1R TaxID=3445771 RepID=UPI003FA33F0D